MIKKLPKSKIEFEISIPWADWEKYLDSACEELSKEIKIPGFRPGKAPRGIVKQKIGKERILNEAAEKAVKKSYVDLIMSEKIEALGRPEIKLGELAEGKELKYSAQVAVMPQISVKERYKKDIEKINRQYQDKKAEVEEDDIKLELDRLANSRAKLVTVLRTAGKNDRVEVDFSVLVNGVPIENGTSQNHPLIIGKEIFIPGFEDNLIGMKEGEEKEFELEFPKDYHKADLQGRKAIFKVKMKLVQERQIPAVDDEFAKSLGKFENLEALQKNMREGMEEEQAHKIKEQKRNDYVEKLIENSEGEIPEILIHEETHKMLHEFEHQVQSMGIPLDKYLEKIKKTQDDLEKDWEPSALKRVKSALALSKIAREENITITSKEIEDEMNRTLQYYKDMDDTAKNIDMEKLYNYTKGVLENEKVFEMLEKL